jgi:hypothetical protein
MIDQRIMEVAEGILGDNPNPKMGGMALLFAMNLKLQCGSPGCYTVDDEKLLQKFLKMPMKEQHLLLDILRMKHSIPLSINSSVWEGLL